MRATTTLWPRTPARLAADEAICFLHVPKTAGTALHHWLIRKFRKRDICPARDAEELLHLRPADRPSYRFYSGHYLFGFELPKFIGRPLTYLTLVREPVAQTISYYNHIRRVTEHPLNDLVRAKYPTIGEFVAGPDAYHLANHQVRFLALFDKVFDADVLKALKSADTTGRDAAGAEVVHRAKRYSDAELLEWAKARLDECAFVGLAERMDDNCRLLAYTFDWPIGRRPKRLNVTPGGAKLDTISPQTIERIRAITRLDAALYDHARRLFESRMAEVGEEKRPVWARALSRVLPAVLASQLGAARG
jgi:hypothetical protein